MRLKESLWMVGARPSSDFVSIVALLCELESFSDVLQPNEYTKWRKAVLLKDGLSAFPVAVFRIKERCRTMEKVA